MMSLLRRITSNTTPRVEGLRRLPWYSIEPPVDVISGKGMIHADERRMLYTLAKDYFVGAGRIIDGGSYLGSSSLALGLGLRDRRYPAVPVIDAYDTFVIDPFAVVWHLDANDPLSGGVKAGDNLRHIYDRNISAVADYISVHEGDLTVRPWNEGPIEILFCDVSKSWELNDYILKNWIPSLIPGTGILIQQDQIQEYHVWVAITMSMLSDYFEIIDYTLNSSMVYRLKRKIPQSVLDRCMSVNVTTDDMVRHYQRSLQTFKRPGMGRYTGWQLGMVELGLSVVYGFHVGDTDNARRVLQDCKSRFSGVVDTMYRASVIEAHLDAGTPCPGSRLYR